MLLPPLRAHHNFVGGAASGQGNVIWGNGQDGINLNGLNLNGLNLSGNVLQGNLIGTGATGSYAITQSTGIVLQNGVRNTVIGGATPTARNVISGHRFSGIYIFSAGTTGTIIQGYFISTDASGTRPIGNGLWGVSIHDGARASVGAASPGAASPGAASPGAASPGAASPGAGNRIAFNKNSGVRVAGATTSAAIRGNAIFSNAGLGINLQPAEEGGSTPSTSFGLDFYSQPSPDPVGHGESAVYLGSATVRTNASGVAT